MKTYNTHFYSASTLQDYIEENNLRSEKRLLIQVFSGTNSQDHFRVILDTCERLLPGAVVIGASTDGEILNETVTVHQTVISFCAFEEGNLYTYSFASSQDVAQIGKRLGEEAVMKKAQMMIVFGDSLRVNADLFLDAVSNESPHLVVCGGLAADNGEYKHILLACGNTIQTEGIVACLVVNEALRISTQYSFNWIPIGPSFTVTKSKNNRVYELDYTPTLRLYTEYLGDSVAASLPAIGSEFPLVMYHNGMQFGRSCTQKHDDGSLSFSGNIPKGAMVQFGIGNIEMMIESSALLSREILAFKPESIFVYSSMARRRFLGKKVEAEITPLSMIAPTVGFFTNGEFFTQRREKQKYFFNNVMSVVALSEKPLVKGQDVIDENSDVVVNHSFGQTFKALSHLINKTSIDLQVLNESLRRRIDQEVQKNREKDKMMLAQSKQATMGEMISMIAHQWRQPITSIGLLSSSLRLDAEFDELKKESVLTMTSQIDDQVQYLSRTIDDFRNYFKPTKNAVKFDINTLFNEVASMSTHFLDRNGIKLDVHLADDIAIKSLKNELMQVLVNIMNNAKDALLERKIKDPMIKLEASMDHKGVIITIKDNAGGIDNEVAERIFEPYFSTKSAKNGTGLGLYMAKTIVEEHLKGVISTLNDEEGAIFILKLPFELEG